MLQNLREHVQGWIAGVIAGILCLAFALWGVEYYIGGSPSRVTVAKVDSFDITQDQWDAAYNRARQSQQIQISDPKLNEAYQNQIKTRALNGLIQAHVLGSAAQKAGYVISPAQVGSIIQQMPAFQLEGRFSYPLFQRTLENLSYTPDTFAQEISKSSLLMQVQRSIAESNFTLPDDLHRNILLQNQKRSFAYLLITPTPFLAKAAVTKEAVENYYKENLKDFTWPEQVSLQYLKLSTEEANKKIAITDQELRQYYEENKSAFTAAKDAKTATTFATAKPALEKALRQQKVEQWVADQTDKLANLTYTHPDTLKAAADSLRLPIQTTPFFAQRGLKKEEDKTGLLSNPKILTAAFNESVFKQRNNSEVIALDDHTAIVLRIAEYKAPVADPLATVQDKIETYLKEQAAWKEATDLGERIVQDMKKGVSAAQLAAQNKLTWTQKNDVSRTQKDKDIPPEILNVAFNQPAPASGDKPAVEGKRLPHGHYAVVVLHAVTTGAASAVDATAHKALQKEMENGFGALDYDLYLAQQMNAAKIKMEAGAKQ
jgi:hypothetical protein